MACGSLPVAIVFFSQHRELIPRKRDRAESSHFSPLIGLKPPAFRLSPRSSPMKKQVPHDKYFLRSLHQEIDLYDRKLAYLEKYGQFDSIADRKDAENKLLSKRASLAETAKQLVSDGVEFNPADLPRSFRAAPELHAEA
jgi:hypothetical protein